MIPFDIEAVYDHGSLKLPRELPLRDGQTVTITVHAVDSAVQRLVGLVPWHGSVEDLDALIECEDNDPLEGS